MSFGSNGPPYHSLILRAVKEVREALLEVRVAGDFVRMTLLAARCNAGPLEAAQVGGVEPFWTTEDRDSGRPAHSRATDGVFKYVENLPTPMVNSHVAGVGVLQDLHVFL